MTRHTWPEIGEMSEDELRKKVIVPLLSQTAGVEQVTDVHGSNERGLDVVFIDESEIRETCVGLQIKTGAIRGGGSQDKTVKTIIDQLELASDFEHAVAINPSGRKQIEHFIVATNGKISNTAREEISDRIDEVPVDFWDINKIMSLIREHYPELATGADSETIQYLLDKQHELNTLDALDQVSGVAQRTLSDVFVEPDLKRKLDPAVTTEGEVVEGAASIGGLDLLEHESHAVIIGDQNAGKTSLLRMLAIRAIDDLLDSTDDEFIPEIPVVLRAKDIVETGSVTEAICDELARHSASDRVDSIREDVGDGAYAILIDGFSELLTEDDKQYCERIIGDFKERYADNSIAIAARPSDFLRSQFFEEFVHFNVAKFDKNQVQTLVDKWTEDGVDLPDVAEKVVDRVRDALQLPGSPIPAVIGVMLYEKENRYITNTWEAVDRYMVIRLGRYAQEMGIRQEVDWTTKQDLLAEVAFDMVKKEEEALEYDELVDEFDEIFERRGEDRKGDDAVRELIDSGVLQRRGREVAFHRTAFRDFFAAHDVADRRGNLESFAVDKIFDRKWGQVLTFAAGSVRHNSNLLRMLSSRVEEKKREDTDGARDDYVYGAYLLGRMLSNSKASDKEPRLRALEVTLHGASAAIPHFEEIAIDKFGNIGELAALLGIEQTFFVTVGVPWLENQLRELMEDEDVSDEEFYLLLSVYANLGCDDWLDEVEDAVGKLTSTRAIVALQIMFERLSAKRHIKAEQRDRYTEIKNDINRKIEKRSDAVQKLLKVKNKVLELERKRMKRLKGG